MTALNASTVPLAVRIRNTRVDQLITGYLHGAPKFQKADPGGFKSASFIVDQRLGFRSDIIQPYSRVYFYNKRNGDCVFEGDVSHPGRSMGGDGALLDVSVEGGAARLNDWSGQRIFIDRDFQAWSLTNTATVGSQADPGEDRGGSGSDALTLAMPNSMHVETNSRAEVGYYRIREAGQELGSFNYAWDGGHTSGSPGWLVRAITSPPSTLVRTQVLNVGGSGGSIAVIGTAFVAGTNVAYMQLIWTGAASSTAATDITWASMLRVIIQCRYMLKDGVTFMAGGDYDDYSTAVKVINDLLGTVLTATFDGANAQIDVGTGYQIRQLAYPNGVTPQQVLDDLTTFEPGCTYIVGPSTPGVDKYSFKWMSRPNVIRYEFVTWADDYSAGAQPTDQYNEAVTRWKSPSGLAKTLTTTQTVPEMTAMGHTRRYFQDLGDSVSDLDNAAQANASVLADHRYPQNGGQVTVSRPVVDLFTGRRVEPFDIEPGYLCRIVGVNPSPDALNATDRNGSTVCRIVATDYDADSHSVSITLDSMPWSMFRAIAGTKKNNRPSLWARFPKGT